MESLDCLLDIYAICACCKYEPSEKSKSKSNSSSKPKSLNAPFVGIGNKNKLPWGSNSLDMKYFTSVTSFTDVTKYQTIQTKRRQAGLWEQNYIDMKLSEMDEGTLQKQVKNVVVMGRLSWESIPNNFKPLKGRINIIMSRTLEPSTINDESVFIVRSVTDVVELLKRIAYYKCFIIGGSVIYKEFLSAGLISKIYMTRINESYDCDVFFPEICPDTYEINSVSQTYAHKDITLDFVVMKKIASDKESTEKENQKYRKNALTNTNASNDDVDDDSVYFEFLKKRKEELRELQVEKSKFEKYLRIQQKDHPEYQYLDILYDILRNGNALGDRTGVGVISKFGYMMRFNLKEYFPLLTTKRVFLRGIIEELLWFIRGETNGNTLLEKNVRIWEANGTREFLDNRKLFHREVNDLGPIYGFQWRHFGAEYVDMHTNYENQGVDQLKNVIELIKNDPTSRRILLCAWNPKDLDQMALPPCHILCQFYVNNKKLSCIMYQRSCDLGLGVPFNIASYSILTYMIAHVCDLEVDEFIHILGNAHIYKNHINELIVQVNRVPYPFPTMHLNPEVKNIEDFKVSDFTIRNYVHHEKIAMEMAA